MRHRTGKYLERSLRYTKAQDFALSEDFSPSVQHDVGRVLTDYFNLVGIEGMDKEVARAILPMGTMTTFYVQYDLRNFIHMCEMRLDPSTQKETRAVVRDMVEEIKDIYPTVYRHIKNKESR